MKPLAQHSADEVLLAPVIDAGLTVAWADERSGDGLSRIPESGSSYRLGDGGLSRRWDGELNVFSIQNNL